MRDDRPKQIGLLDAMGGGNLGDAAIQDSVIANIKSRRPDARIVGFSFVPDDTVRRHGIPCHPLTRWARPSARPAVPSSSGASRPGGLKSALKRLPGLRAAARPALETAREWLFLVRSYRVLRGLDLLVISGGGQLCELWGGPWAHLYNVFKFSLLAKLAGCRLCFLNVGAEPLEHRLSRCFAKTAVRLADYVSFRDDYSQALVRGLGVKAKTCVHADPAYALETSRYLQPDAGSPSAPVVGINPLCFCDPRIWPRKDQAVYEAYLDKLTRFSLWLLEEGYDLKLFTTSAGVDQLAIADLKQRLLTHATATRVKEAVCGNVGEMLRELSGCDFIVTSRYHGVVFAHLLRKPVIALSYQGKSSVAMEPVGLGGFCANIEHFEVDWLVGAFRQLVQNRESIQSREASAVAAYGETLRRQFDELFSPAGPARKPAFRQVPA